MSVEIVHLRPDHPISRVIKGCWQLAGDHGAVDRAAAIADMEAFLDAGITTFDCADIYTGVEEMIGHFIADIRSRRGVDVADRVTVHTKLVPDLALLDTISGDQIEAMVDRSLRRLNLDQVHLVQFFWWDTRLGNPIRAMEQLARIKEKGKIRHIGVTNWDVPETERLMQAGADLVSTQVQYSILDRRPARTLAPWALRNELQLLCYGTLAGGFLTERWLGKPDPGFVFENRSLVKYRLIIDEFGPWDLFQELLGVLKATGDRHGVSLSSVATRWVLDQPQVAAAIVGARYARHLPKTLEVFGLKLDSEDRARINAVLSRAKGPTGPVYGLESDREGRHGRIMKYNLNTRPDAPTGAEEGAGG
ncbi:aldo/keto reductase [Chelativorans intermedius]|uniref:Aldo/keto reductase n=1 Tax=Chelativorans intermedius TaxID=515947 RepID=A0ABV6D643_9HYPH|nr:aldo/keto reductase [Chelativorans intermedius]MCT8997426.1 aldo/keto reductase [Chelativorans intermedius]